jgi:hypothetical protein
MNLGLRLLGFRQGSLGGHGDEGIQRRIETLDCLKTIVHEVNGRNFAAPDLL